MEREQSDGHPVALWRLISFGYELRDLQSCSHETKIFTKDPADQGVLDRLRSLVREMEFLELRETDWYAGKTIAPLLLDLDYLPRDIDTLGSYAEDLRQHLQDLTDLVRQEAAAHYLYPVQPMGNVDLRRLIREPLCLFDLPDELTVEMSPFMSHNLEEAARCIAAGFGLAAATLIFNTTEAVIRYYYRNVTGGQEPKLENGRDMTWLQMKEELRNRRCCPQQIITALTSTGNKRNQLVHGNLTAPVSSRTAYEWWQSCAALVRRMTCHLRELEMQKA